MSRNFLYLGLLYFVLHAAAAAKEPPESDQASHLPSIVLRVGQRYPIEGLMTSDVRVQPETVAKAHQTAQGILLVGLAPGTARLTTTVGEKRIEVQVIVREEERAKGPWIEVLTELRRLPGLQFRTLGRKILVQGEVLSRAAYQHLLLAATTYPKHLLVLATPAPGIKASLIEQAETTLHQQGLMSTRITNAGNRFFLEGFVSTPQEVEHAIETAQSVIPNVENHLPVPIRIDPTISVRVFLLELSRHAHQELGLSWPSGVRDALLIQPGNVRFGPAWIANLKHLSAEGHAKILAEPLLAVKSGGEAELSAGGEIPLRITGKYENKVVWKYYGLRIKLNIQGVAGKHVRTKIESESSQLDDATAVEGIPGVRKTSMSTEVDAVVDQPVLLTGLFQATAARDVDKLPVLGSIPLLGELFKSRRFREHESELLVALLPSFGAPRADLPLGGAHGLEFDMKWRPLD